MKLANIQWLKQVLSVRVPMNLALDPKFDPKTMFLPHEVSTYIERVLQTMGIDWIDIVSDDPDYLEAIAHNGHMFDGEKYRTVFAFWRDNEGRAVLVPTTSGISDLQDLGIITHMDEINQCSKVGKYVYRITSPAPKSQPGNWGDEVSFDHIDENGHQIGRSVIRLENGTEIVVLFDDMEGYDADTKAACDGSIEMGPEAIFNLGWHEKPNLGTAFHAFTGSTTHGLGKGNAQCIPWMGNKIRIFGPKALVTTERCFFMQQGILGAGEVHTDAQSFWNFDFHRPELAVPLARAYMHEIWDAAQNEKKLRRAFLKYTRKAAQTETLDLEGWILRRALCYGLSILRFPGLFRRVVRYLMKKVMDCERARIPMGRVAVYAYVLPDPYIFDENGKPNLEMSRIAEGEIVAPAIQQGSEIVAYRQPSENANAHVFLHVIYSDGYRRFKNKGICLLGKGAAAVLARLGGGDMDDCFVLVFDETWVKSFLTLPKYPETHKVEPTKKQRELYADEEFFQSLQLPERQVKNYGIRHFCFQIEQARRSGAGIGPVVNVIGIDNLLSHPEHRQAMLDDLMARGTDVALEQAAWLEKRARYQAALYATNLELVIDGHAKDITLLQALGNVPEFNKRFHESIMVYPVSMQGRIPMSKLAKGDYTLAKSKMCQALETIGLMRDQLMERFKEKEWLIAGPADRTLLEYFPVDQEVRKIVKELRTIWREEWTKAFEAGLTDEDRASTHARVEKIIGDELKQYPAQVKIEIAAELYRQLYRTSFAEAKMDERTGKRRNFPDGLLWTHDLGNALIDAFRVAGLSGFYWPLQTDGQYPEIYTQTVQVRAVDGVIFRHEDNAFLGFAERVPDGNYLMDGGLITVREAAEGLLPLAE